MNSYGKIRFGRRPRSPDRKSYWAIDATPHLRARLRRLFLVAESQSGNTIYLSDTLPNAADLEMLLHRYPMEMDDAARNHLLFRSQEFSTQIEQYDLIISGDYEASPIETLIPLRHYQEQAVHIGMTRNRLLCGDDLGLGKAQPHDEPVITPDGWRKFGDLVIGDLVYGTEGKPTPVLAIHEQGIKPIYTITFSDGTKVRCCKEHLWTVRTTAMGGFKTFSLEQILNKGIIGKNGKPKFYVPQQQAVERPDADLPVDPYFLGVILGDGCVAEKQTNLQVTIGNRDLDILTRIPEPQNIRDAPGCKQLGYPAATLRLLWSIGVKGRSSEKLIPDQYLLGSKSQRIELLRGLLDTDGSCGERNKTYFHSCNGNLCLQVKELVESLGGYATIRSYDRGEKGTEYQVRIQTTFCPFYTKEKLKNWAIPSLGKLRRRKIVEVEYSGESNCRCISVDGSHYLTTGHIVTHNTGVALGMIAAGAGRTLILCQTHLQQQWQFEAEKFLNGVNVHICQSTRPYSLPEHDILIMPYSKVRGWSDILQETHGLVVADECQELRKDDSAKYRCCKRIMDVAPRVLGLSATPIFNYGDEAFTVFDAIETGCLGTKQEFLREWCIYNGGHYLVKDPQALGDYLNKELKIFLRRRRHEVGKDLPPMSKIVHPVEYNQARFNASLSQQTQLAHAVFNAGTNQERGMASMNLDMFVRQQTGLAKAPHVADFVSELVRNGEKVVLAGWHRAVYEIWQSEFSRQDIKSVLYTGSESSTQKAQAVRDFIEGDAQVFIISLRSGAGLNGLQNVSNLIVIGEMDWSPQVIDQLGGRIRRDGQEESTTMIYLISTVGSDPEMASVLGLKSEQSQGIINPGEDRVSVFASVGDVEESRGRRLAASILERTGRSRIPTS